MGSEQPVYVDPAAPRDSSPGYCLFNMDQRTIPIECSAKHRHTQRLCICK